MNSPAAVLGRQIRHELVSLLRGPLTMILCVGFPLLFFIMLSALIGNAVVDESTGVRLVQFLAPALASFGVIMATFSFLASGLSEVRANGVLKRQLGTPLPRATLIGGRIGAAVLLGFIAVTLVLAVGALFYGLQLPVRTLPAVLVTLLLSSVTFAALGIAFALLLPTPAAVVAVTNGIAIVLSFISGVFMVSGSTPAWMNTLAWVFPLKPMVVLFSEALNPYLSGSGFIWRYLAEIAAWGLAGAGLALWALRSGRERKQVTAASGRARPEDRTPRRTARPSFATLLAGQVAHAQAMLWRDASSVFFAVVFPLLLVAIIPTVNGGGDADIGGGMLLGSFYAATMAIYGSAVTSFVNMPEALAEDRDRGVLKRTRAAPLPLAAMLGGRVVAALLVSLLTLLAIALLAASMYPVPVPPAWPVAVLVLAVSSVMFAILGLAITALVSSPQAVIGATLGTLLPLCFISGIFVVGVQLPPFLDAVSLFFPLRHAAEAMTGATAPVAGPFPTVHLLVMLAWAAAGLAVIATRFRWEVARDSPPRSSRAGKGRPAQRLRGAATP